MEPGAAVVIPCRNEANTIVPLLDALAGQSRVPQLIVVVGDESTDDTRALMERWTRAHVAPVGDARERQSVKCYLVAMIVPLFDIEVAFLYHWAMAPGDLRWVGFAQILVFVGLLATGHTYAWRKGVFDWGTAR